MKTIASLAAVLALAATAVRADAIDDAFAPFAKPGSPGCALGMRGAAGQPTFRAWGQADLEHGIGNTPETVFEAGSVSKQFTAAAILTLVADGKLSLSDDVRKYLPELPVYPQKVTVESMLTHTAGLRDWGEVAGLGGWPRGARAYTNLEALEIASRQKALNYPVGAEWSYSNTGYNLAAVLVSRVSGQSFADFTRDRLFRPLGMTHTAWRDDFRRVVPGRAIAYQPGGGGWRQDMPFEDVHGNGGLLTTVADLLVWNTALTAGRLGPAVPQGLQKEALLNDGRRTGYARGLFVGQYRGVAEVSHSGATAGYRAWLGRYPSQGLSIAVLCNAANADATALAHKVADLSLPAPQAPPPEPAARPTPPAELAARPGVYVQRGGGGSVNRIVVEDGRLRLRGGPVLQPAAGGGYTAGSSQVRFLPNGDLQRRTPEGAVTVYERAAPVDTGPTALAGLSGTYVSEEADARLILTDKAGRLTLSYGDRPSAATTLEPLFRDGFGANGATIRVLRDKAGHPQGLMVSTPRVWDLRFRKVG